MSDYKSICQKCGRNLAIGKVAKKDLPVKCERCGADLIWDTRN